jgi:hypothetical protein
MTIRGGGGPRITPVTPALCRGPPRSGSHRQRFQPQPQPRARSFAQSPASWSCCVPISPAASPRPKRRRFAEWWIPEQVRDDNGKSAAARPKPKLVTPASCRGPLRSGSSPSPRKQGRSNQSPVNRSGCVPTAPAGSPRPKPRRFAAPWIPEQVRDDDKRGDEPRTTAVTPALCRGPRRSGSHRQRFQPQPQPQPQPRARSFAQSPASWSGCVPIAPAASPRLKPRRFAAPWIPEQVRDDDKRGRRAQSQNRHPGLVPGSTAPPPESVNGSSPSTTARSFHSGFCRSIRLRFQSRR